MSKNTVSNSVIRRLPRYYRFLGELEKMNIVRISSRELSEKMRLTASQIRQDFNCFGGFGQQGYGYNVKELREKIGDILVSESRCKHLTRKSKLINSINLCLSASRCTPFFAKKVSTNISLAKIDFLIFKFQFGGLSCGYRKPSLCKGGGTTEGGGRYSIHKNVICFFSLFPPQQTQQTTQLQKQHQILYLFCNL